MINWKTLLEICTIFFAVMKFHKFDYPSDRRMDERNDTSQFDKLNLKPYIYVNMYVNIFLST